MINVIKTEETYLYTKCHSKGSHPLISRENIWRKKNMWKILCLPFFFFFGVCVCVCVQGGGGV
jgi:hypothetical protein